MTVIIKGNLNTKIIALIIIFFMSTKKTNPNPKPQSKLRKSKSLIILNQDQHEVVSTFLPKNYALVQKQYFEDFVKSNTKIQLFREKHKNTQKAHSQDCKEEIKKENDQGLRQIPIQQTSNLLPQTEKISTKQSIQHKESDSEAKNAQQPIIGKQQIRQQILAEDNLASSLQRIVREMINHPTFQILYATRRENPNLRKHLREIDRRLKSKKYEIQQFKQDVNTFFSIYFSMGEKTENINIFQALIISKIVELSKQVQSQSKQKIKQKEQKQQPQMIVIEDTSSQHGRLERQKRQTRSNYVKTKQYSNQYEELIPLPVKKGRNSIPQRPHSTKIQLKDIATLGYNMAKLPSKDLQSICITFCNSQYMNNTKQVQYYNINLQKITASEFLQLQAFVKNALKSQKNIYQLLADPDEEDDYFVIKEDD